ncbi:MAG: Uma2 family endonuclease [Kastovskya adunca ATA6-11-RM4]|jgi:Uma2 family endonuclease|nr:Uma2 family endonuclease [Kastovskya adunca ATA6-11-RM4]
MSQSVTTGNEIFPQAEQEWVEVPAPDISHLVTEDDTPVDNLISEKQQRLLTACLYSSRSGDVPFLATANVGLFYGIKQPPLVPDVLLSLEVSVPEDWSQKQNRSYFVWHFGKPPEVAIEIVSNTVGNELGSKLRDYARAGVAYYIVFDPLQFLDDVVLRVHQLQGTSYRLLDDCWMEQIELGVTLWEGSFEGKHYTWLRWCDRSGNLLLTGDERAEQERQRAEQERQRAEQEHQRAEQERQRAEQEHQRAERLAELLRARGIDPDEAL